MSIFKTKAPAKINIGLNVVNKREDGFHNIETLFYPLLDFYDLLLFEENSKLEIVTKNYDLPFRDNLIYKAVKLLEEKSSRKIKVKITLVKNIPVGAGLGGGSSDAAATLKGLNEFAQLGLSEEELMIFALKLGSDVPYFINPVPALGYSRGEILRPVNFKINLPILIINPNVQISTAEAFRKIIPSNPKIKIETIFSDNKVNDFNFLKSNIVNDFESIVFKTYPLIREIKNKLYESGALFALMSGTGSTVFGIFENKKKAEKALMSFPANYFKLICNKQRIT